MPQPPVPQPSVPQPSVPQPSVPQPSVPQPPAPTTHRPPPALVGPPLPPLSSGLPPRRVAGGAALVLGGLPLLTAVLAARRDDLAYATPVLLVLLLVVAGALVGGLRVGLPAALLGGLDLNWWFTPPYGTLVVDQPAQLVVLGVYLTVAVGVSAVVGLAARRTAEAARARAEAQALAGLAGATLAAAQTLPELLERVRTTFGMREVRLLETGEGREREAARVGTDPAQPGEVELRVPAAPGVVLAARGPELFAEDRAVLASLAGAAATALQGRRLAEQAELHAGIAAADRMRSALLAAVGHDLRTPLAGIRAAASSLRATDVAFTAAERDELLETIEGSTDRLQALVANLLDASRLEAGAVSVRVAAAGLDEVTGRVLLALPAADRDRVHVAVPDDLPEVLADAGLLERVLANLLDNALRHAPAGSIVTVTGTARGAFVACDVVDHGPGVPARDRERVFAPFQRLGDRTRGGVGLGLVVARGLTEAMSGTLVPRDTRGGGLTMQVRLPAAVRP